MIDYQILSWFCAPRVAWILFWIFSRLLMLEILILAALFAFYLKEAFLTVLSFSLP